MYRRTTLQRAQRVSAREVRKAHRKFHRYLRGDRQQRVREAVEAIETLLSSYQKQDAWKCIAIWYRQASGGQDPPSRDHLYRIATERAELYRCRTPEGLRVPILVFPEELEDGVPEEA